MAQFRRWIFLCACATGACGAAKSSSSPPKVSPSASSSVPAPAPVAASAASTAANAPAPQVEPTFARTEALGPAACSLEGVPWLPDDEEALLSLRPDGAPFVRVAVSDAQIEIPVGKANVVFVRMEGIGWHVAGHLAATSLTLRPLRIQIHDGFLVPTEFADLELVEADRGTLRLVVRLPRAIRTTLPREPRSYACDEVNVGPPPQLDAEAVIPGDPRKRRSAFFAQREIPLSLEPGAPPVAWVNSIDVRSEGLELERRGMQSRIAVTDLTVMPFGWASKSDVHIEKKSDEVWGTGSLGLSGGYDPKPVPTPPRLARFLCHEEIPLLVRVGDQVMQVGSVDPKRQIETTGPGGVTVPLKAPDWLRLAPGASFETLKEALKRCVSEPQLTPPPDGSKRPAQAQ